MFKSGVFVLAVFGVLSVGASVPAVASVEAVENAGCDCQDTYTCGCCLGLDIEELQLNETGCVNVTYLQDKKTFEFSVSLNNQILYQRDVSVANIPPACLGFRSFVQVCGKLFDLNFKEKDISGCLGLEVWERGNEVLNLTLGCFTIPVSQASHPLVFQAGPAPALADRELPGDFETFVKMAARKNNLMGYLALQDSLLGLHRAAQETRKAQAVKTEP